MEGNKKVYCRDCKYFQAFSYYTVERCLHEDNGQVMSNDTYERPGFKWAGESLPKHQNEHNDCNLFKPKWYRRGKYRNK